MIGHPITNHAVTGDMYGYSGQCMLTYLPLRALWIAANYEQGENDWYLSRKPAKPATEGDPTVWPLVPWSGGGDAFLDSRGSGWPHIYPHGDGETFSVFVVHSSSRRYKQGRINAAGEVDWLIGANGNGESVGFSASQGRIQGVVDTLDRPWFCFTYTTGLNVRVRDAGAWQAQLAVTSHPSYSDHAGGVFQYVHTDGSPGIGVVQNIGANDFAFYWRRDSDPLTALWQQEWVRTVPWVLDNHTDAMAAELPGDTGSTLFGCVKRSSSGNTVDAFRAAPGAAPDPNLPQLVPIGANITRASAGIDATNGLGRISGQNSGSQNPLQATEFDITAPLPATAPAASALVDNTGAARSLGHDAPNHPVTSDSGWVYRSQQTDVWWNEDPIAGGEPTLAIDGATHAHTAANVALGFEALLAPAELRHPHTAELVPLDVRLAVDEGRHKHVAENVDLVQASSIVLAELRHPHAAANVELAGGAVLELAALRHPHTAELVTFVPADVLMLEELRHRHTAELVDLVQAGNLVIQGARHPHQAANVALVLDLALDVDPGRHKHVAENVVLDTSTILELAELRHRHTAELVDLVQAGGLVIQGARHPHFAANVILIDDQGKPIIDPSARVYVAFDAARVYIARDPVPRIT